MLTQAELRHLPWYCSCREVKAAVIASQVILGYKVSITLDLKSRKRLTLSKS